MGCDDDDDDDDEGADDDVGLRGVLEDVLVVVLTETNDGVEGNDDV